MAILWWKDKQHMGRTLCDGRRLPVWHAAECLSAVAQALLNEARTALLWPMAKDE